MFCSTDKGTINQKAVLRNRAKLVEDMYRDPAPQHGAAPNSSMAHIGIVEQLDGKSVEWIEKVGEAQYKEPIRDQD